jgi:putative oxidoreductase
MHSCGRNEMEKICGYLSPLGRLLLSSLFVWAGYGKLMNPGAAAQEFASVGVPAPALMVGVAILVELVGGLALFVGFRSRWVAGVLAIWCLVTAFAVHLAAGMHSTDPATAYDNMIHFYKNLGIAGGLIYVIAFGAGRLSIDNRAQRRSST